MTKRMLGIFFLTAAIPVWAEEADVRTTGVMPGAQILFHGATSWSLAEDNMILESGDRLQTGPGSRLSVAFRGEDVLMLGEDSDVSLDRLDEKLTSVRLFLGQAFAKITRTLEPGEKMEIRTPTAVAAVRGTEFVVEVQEKALAEQADMVTDVGVFEGEVDVVSEAEGQTSVSLSAEEEARVSLGKPIERQRVLLRMSKHQARMLELRERHANLRNQWKPLNPLERRALRAQMMARRPLRPLRDLHQERLERQEMRLKQLKHFRKRPAPPRRPHRDRRPPR